MNTSENEHNDFIQELIETIYIQLEQSIENTNKLEKFKLIIKGVINFLKENELSNDAIRTGLIEFFHLRRSYVRTEYQIGFHQIGLIVENILANGSDVDLNNELEETSSGDTGAPSLSNNQSPMSAITSLALQLLSHQNLYNLQNSQPLIYTYQPYMGLPTINVPTSGLTASGLTASGLTASGLTASGLTVSGSGVSGSSSLASFLLNLPNQNVIASSVENEEEDDIEGDIEAENEVGPPIPTVYGYNPSTANLLLNFVNIYMNGAPPPLAPMVDVKNVVTEKQLEQLKVVTYLDLKTEEIEKYKDCVICLDSFEKDSKLRILKCDHGFHVDCIDKWLTDCNYKCPVCRDDSNEHHAEI